MTWTHQHQEAFDKLESIKINYKILKIVCNNRLIIYSQITNSNKPKLILDTTYIKLRVP